MEFTELDPGAGSTASLASLKTALDKQATNVGEAVQTLQTMLNGIHESWTGVAADMAGSDVSGILRSAILLHDRLSSCVSTLSTYRSEHARVKTEAAPWKQKLEAAEADQWSLVLDGGIGSDESLALTKEKKEAQAKLKGLYDERVKARDAFVSAIAGLVPEWPAMRSAFSQAGVDPMTATPVQIADAMAALAKKHCDEVPIPSDVVKSLNSLLNLYGGDEAAMSEFFRKLGGENTAKLTDAINASLTSNDRDIHDLPTESLLDLALRLRSGLALGSSDWTDKQGETFASGLLKHTQAAGFLFDGPPYLGESLATAAADIVDDQERGKDGKPLSSASVYTLNSLLNGNSADEGFPAGDLSGRVFETLGQYPDAAADFLTDPKQGEGRVSYWFGERDWGYPDNFTGPTALLYGAQQAAGGPGDPAGAYDKERWDSIALMTSGALDALGKNEDFKTDKMNEESSISLAGVIAVNLPGFTEYPINATQSVANPPDVFPVGLLDSDNKRSVPVISASALARLMGVAGSFSGGATVLTHATSAYEGALAVAAQSPSDVVKAMDRAAVLDATIHGAVAGTRLADAQSFDAEQQRQVDEVLSLIGYIPVPGLSTLMNGSAAAAKGIADFVQSYAMDKGAEGVESSLLENRTADVLAQNMKDETARMALANYKTGMFLATALGVPVTPLDGNPSVKEMTEWYATNHDRLSEKLEEVDPNGEISLDKIARDWEAYYSDGKEDAE